MSVSPSPIIHRADTFSDILTQYLSHYDDNSDDETTSDFPTAPNNDDYEDDFPSNRYIFHDTGIGEIALKDLVLMFESDLTSLQRRKVAIKLLNSKVSFDWAKESLPLKPPDEETDPYYEFHTYHYLDFIHVMGLPGRVLTAKGTVFSSIQLQIKFWEMPFTNLKSHVIPFNLEGRTFYLAQDGNLHWFIVLQPFEDDEYYSVKRNSSHTALNKVRGLKLLDFIVNCLETGSLMHLGYETRTYRNHSIKKLTAHDFYELQRIVIERWNNWMKNDLIDNFWNVHEPTFHVYDIGSNDSMTGNFQP